MTLEALHEQAQTLGFQVSWAKTKVQMFGGLLDELVHVARTMRSWKTSHTLVV